MDKILYVDACVRETSRTRRLADHLTEYLDGNVEKVDLVISDIFPLNGEKLEYRDKLVENENYEDYMLRWARQFSEADIIVLAAPYWDLSFPACVKAYIEAITVKGITFEYGKNGIPHGLCKAKKLIYVMTAGGMVEDRNFGFDYIKAIASGMFGINEVICIKTEGLDIEGADVEDLLSKTMEEVFTLLGDPSDPCGDAGEKMLDRMNDSHSGLTDWALGFMDFKGSENVLDIGCGGGSALSKIAENISGGHICGIDHSPLSVALSKKKNKEIINQGRMSVIEGDVQDLPFGNESFDRIITIESFYFWPDPDEDLREVYRVLRPGGKFILVADIYEKANLSEKDRENIRRYDMTVLSEERFYELFENAGYDNIKIHLKKDTDWIAIEGSRS